MGLREETQTSPNLMKAGMGEEVIQLSLILEQTKAQED
jgi:hypothetical protein